MLTSIEGIYRNGRVELTEQPTDIYEGTRVIVTFMRSNDIDLASQGIKEAQAVVLRSQLAIFADDWDSPEMSIYDNKHITYYKLQITNYELRITNYWLYQAFRHCCICLISTFWALIISWANCLISGRLDLLKVSCAIVTAP